MLFNAAAAAAAEEADPDPIMSLMSITLLPLSKFCTDDDVNVDVGSKPGGQSDFFFLEMSDADLVDDVEEPVTVPVPNSIPFKLLEVEALRLKTLSELRKLLLALLNLDLMLFIEPMLLNMSAIIPESR